MTMTLIDVCFNLARNVKIPTKLRNICYKTWAFNKYNAIAARYAHLRVLTSETTHAEVVAEDLGEILL